MEWHVLIQWISCLSGLRLRPASIDERVCVVWNIICSDKRKKQIAMSPKLLSKCISMTWDIANLVCAIRLQVFSVISIWLPRKRLTTKTAHVRVWGGGGAITPTSVLPARQPAVLWSRVGEAKVKFNHPFAPRTTVRLAAVLRGQLQ